MLTDVFYVSLAAAVKGDTNFYVAVGAGEVNWDQTLPSYQRNTWQLVAEVARKPVSVTDVRYLDEQGGETEVPTTRLCIRVAFMEGEGEGTLRECGLFGGEASDAANSGTLLSYFIHPRIDKTAGMILGRSFRLDLTPRASGPGQVVTRYLGNSKSQEFHDLDNLTAACQVDEIRFDRRIYFASPEQATALGYDFCAFCFGRELSQR